MAKSLVLTVLSDDRPGIVEQLSEAIANNGGVWVESSMASLAGKFAGILRVRAPEAKVEAMCDALTALTEQGLHVQVEESSSEAPSGDFYSLRVELFGPDRPGIVHHIAQALAARNISVEELVTEVVHASMAGGELFQAVAVLQVPNSVVADELEDQLDALANELTMDINIEEVAED